MVKYKNIQEYLKQNYSDKETVKFITFNATSLTLEESKELIISDYPQLEKIITQGSGNIKNINKVTVNNCPQLKEIKISKFSDNKKLEIKDCPNIEIIYCRENQLTELDISDFPQLKELSCGTNKITNLDLSNCLQLEKLWCGNNQLSSLDLSNYARLKEIYCNANKLTSLKLNNCHQLEIIECYANHLNNLDLTGCEQLKILKCWINQLTQLDLSQNKHLTELRCSKNKINELNLPEKLNNLHCLYCSVNQLADLDFLNSLNPEKLEKISVGENNFPPHDLTVFTPFKELKELKIDSVTGQGSFTGSLKILQKLEKLEVLDIRGNDDIDQGLKYLLKSLKDLSCARTKLAKSKEIKKIPKQYYSVDKSNIDHYDIDKWREDQQDTIIEVIPLERLFVIRSNLKKYVDKWSKEEDYEWYQLNQKQTEKQIALVRLQNPTDYSKSWWIFTGLQWVNRAASVVGGSLVFVGQSDTENPNSQLHTQVGGVIAIASPFVETLTSYVNDQIYAAKQKTWDEFISDTKNTLESYHELLGILEKIEKKEIGEVNKVLNDLREATKIFLDEYDKEDRANNIRKNGVIDIDEITENKPREKFAKDLSRERKWTGASQLGRIVGMMKKLEEGIINYRQERDIDAQQHGNCLEELDNQKQELAWTIIDILKDYSSSEFDSEIEYNEKGKINWNGKSTWESYLKNEIRDEKEFEEKKENLLLPLAEIIAKRLENTNIQTLLNEPQDKNKLVEFLKKTKDFCETCQRLKGLENNLSSLKDNIEELQKLIVKSDTEAKEELVVAIRNEEEKELKTIIETIKNLEQSLGTLHAKLTDNKGKEKTEYVAQQEHVVDNNGRFASGSK